MHQKWRAVLGANKFDLITKWSCQSWFHFVHVENVMFVHQKTHCRQKLAEGRVRLLGGKPGDRSLGLPGNLVGFMPQSTRWCPPCHSPPGSLWGSEWGGRWGWGVSSSSQNQLLLLLKTKDYNENLNCLQPLHGVHHLRNVLLLWETPTHDQRSGGCVHIVMIASISF